MNVSKKSASDKQLGGTFRPDKIEPVIEGSEVTNFKPPIYLNSDAKKWYKKHLPLLVENGIIKASDLTAFAFCASVFGDYILYSRLLEKAKSDEDQNLGDIIKLQKLKNSQQKQFLEYSKSLGLTSVDRGKIKINETERIDDPFNEFC